MSGFDNLYRTDVLGSQNAQFYDAQRYRSMSEMGQAIGSLPERIQGMQMRRQDMMAQREMMEMNRVRLESDMRLQEATIEAQFHKNKIATMMAVDDAKRSRLDVEQRQIANRMASLQSRQLERQLETADEDFQTNVATRLLSVGARDLAEYGIGIATQGRGLAARQLDEDERDRILSRYGRDSGAMVEMRRSAAEARQGMNALRQKYSVSGIFDADGLRSNAADWARYQQFESIVDRWVQQYGGDPSMLDGMGGMAPQFNPTPDGPGDISGAIPRADGGGGGPAGERERVRQIPESTQRAAGMMMQQAAEFMGEAWAQLPEDRRQGLGLVLGRAVESVLAKQPRYDPQMAGRLVMQEFDQGGFNSAFYLRAAGYSDDQIRMWLKAKGRSEGTIQAMMQRLDAASTNK